MTGRTTREAVIRSGSPGPSPRSLAPSGGPAARHAPTAAGTSATGGAPGTPETPAGRLSALPGRAATGAGRAADRPPVLLLHGFVDNRSVFVLLRRSLRRHGHRVEALNYSPLTCDIRAAAAELGARVEEICERTGHARIDVVGHSLGGLIARYYAQRLDGHHRVRTLVTLGAPHSGTTVAPWLSAHPLIRQMRPDSDVIAELAGPARGCSTRFICFWSDLDQVAVPPATARIEHPDLTVVNIRVSGIGHLALPVHGAVAAEIRRVLEPPCSDSGAGQAGSAA
uniref:esterase/lipase family protein n=1 Tax=Streptomyces zingiberis TaxID=2053010 RepID=UPI0035D44A92